MSRVNTAVNGERKPRWFSPLRDLELFVLGKEAPDLLERLGRHDQVARRRAGRI